MYLALSLNQPIENHIGFFIHLSDGCYIGEVGGFLKWICPSDPKYEKYQCHNSGEYYYLDYKYISLWKGQLCSNDPHSYQACDKMVVGYKLTDSDTLCGN